MSGGELFDRIAAEDYKMSEAEVINYMRQVCDGLRYMHENSIVHLDVKVSYIDLRGLNPFKPSIFFVGRPLRLSTVCLQEGLLEFE